MHLLRPLLSVLLPDDCPACGAVAGTAGSRLCVSCASLVPGLPRAIEVPEPIRGAWALGPYQGPLGAMVRRGKYRPDAGAILELGERLADAAKGRLPRVDTVTHVPVPWQRRVRRGFDQGALLAGAVAREIGAPHRPLLRRVRVEEQASRPDRARKKGARGAFRLLEDQRLPHTVLLVDDVVTTGSTAAACADELLAGGASTVLLLAVAARGA